MVDHRSVDVGGVRLAYRASGPSDAPPLVLPHAPGEGAGDRGMVLAVRRQIDTPDPGWLERLDGITAETLVVAGGPRSHVPRDGVAESARRISGGRLVTVPVGHLVHDAAPEAFTEAVPAFLSAEEGSRPPAR